MLSFQNSVSLVEGEPDLVTFTNFWEPEDGFIWSTGKWCEIHFAFQISAAHASTKSADLIFDIDVFRANEETGQNVKIYLNGLRIGTVYLVRRAIYIATFDPKILRAADNVLTLDTPDSHSPKTYGGEDYRVLGVQIYSLQIRKNS